MLREHNHEAFLNAMSAVSRLEEASDLLTRKAEPADNPAPYEVC